MHLHYALKTYFDEYNTIFKIFYEMVKLLRLKSTCEISHDI